MGLVISALELPLQVTFAISLKTLKTFRPRKSLSVRCFHPEEASGILPEEWQLDAVQPGRTYLLEGSTKDNQHIQIEIVTHQNYNSVSLILADSSRILGGHFTGPTADKKTIKCGPFFMEMREPFRRWRVNFKGYLGNEEDRSFVTIAGWWKPTSDGRFFYSDLGFSDLKFKKSFDLAGNLSTISRVFFSEDMSHFGQLLAEVSIDGEATTEMRFRGVRQISSRQEDKNIREFHLYLEDGNRVTHRIVEDGEKNLSSHGFMEKGDLLTSSISLKKDETINIGNHQPIQFNLLDGRLAYDNPILTISKVSPSVDFSYSSSSGHLVDLQWVQVKSVKSRGFALLRTIREDISPVEHPTFMKIQEVVASPKERESAVLPFSSLACQDKSFTGGKGANLAKLKSMEKEYSVPNGVVITTAAFNSFLDANKSIKEMVKKLSQNGLSIEEYVKQGEKIADAIKAADPVKSLLNCLRLSKEARFAVRSSAVGEDGSDLSSAGQLESILDVKFEEIPSKILDCWSSNFRKEVISYRRNYGQILNPPMAVVVQEMIKDGVAGVMFTCDPVKNDDGWMVINAIQGCGEDIVSGAVTPDEIHVEKRNFSLKKPENCCLDEESLQKLISVGLTLESSFGAAQDVEFVIKNGEIFLVQSRDVTGRDRESRFELLTEFDSAALTDRELYSTANVGEVMPVPMTPLEISNAIDQGDRIISSQLLKDLKGSSKLPRHHLVAFFVHNNRLLFNIGQLFMRLAEVVSKDRLSEYSLAGCQIFTPEMFAEGLERYGKLPRFFLLKRLQVMFNLMFNRTYKLPEEIKKELKIIEDLTPKSGKFEFEELIEIIHKQNSVYHKLFEKHNEASMFSSFTYVMVGTLIRGTGEGDITPDTLSDLANIFSNSTSLVISADVPSSLRKLANAILVDGLKEEFIASDDEAALTLLKIKGKESNHQLTEFLKIHGHRGPNELYLRTKTWADKPEMLTATLKGILSTPVEEKEINQSKSLDELVDSLKCKPQGFRRWLMKYMVGESHRGVAGREFAKSCLVKAVSNFRITVRFMTKILYEKGILPDEDLVYFMLFDEVKELYKTRNPKLIARAMRRRQIFPEFSEKRYPHLMDGLPEPIDSNNLTTTIAGSSLKGTVVCEGKVRAKARVAINLAEAKETQPGEILITRCTDICWSPYFPIIKGIVTEIGGLLSHGAVVAREYGLPSLIAVHEATVVFKTGDIVELDTYKGTISKVEESQ